MKPNTPDDPEGVLVDECADLRHPTFPLLVMIRILLQ